MDNVADAIITTDPDGIIEQANMSCYQLFGHVSASLVGQHWSILLAEADHLQELYSATSEPQLLYHTEGCHADQSRFPLAVRRCPLQLQQQTKQLVVLRDLSAEQQSEQLKQQFISTVSFELRTPISAITAAVGLLLSGAGGNVSAAQLRILQLAKSNGQQLLTLLNDLLQVEHIASDTLALQLQPVTLHLLLQQCAKQCHVLHPETELQLSCDDGLQQAQVLADDSKLQQVVNRLLHNAVRFSTSDAAIQLSLSRHGNQLRIMVQDHGCGIPDHNVPLLFSRYRQTDIADNPLHKSTGLGLAVSRSLISQMHGSIGYKPAALQGSCFYIDLPFIETIPA